MTTTVAAEPGEWLSLTDAASLIRESREKTLRLCLRGRLEHRRNERYEHQVSLASALQYKAAQGT